VAAPPSPEKLQGVMPLPATVVMIPLGETLRMRLLRPSLKNRLPLTLSHQRFDQFSDRDVSSAVYGGTKIKVLFNPESVFAFTPESCSESGRNAVRLQPGTLFAFARNPQSSAYFHRCGPERVMWNSVMFAASLLPRSKFQVF
jgi:hypothetical protein